MKKILLTSFCAVALTAASYGQGFINWGTISPTFFTAQTNSTQYSPLTDQGLGSGAAAQNGSVGATVGGGAQFYYALLFAAAGTAAPTTAAGFSGWSPVTLNGQPNAVLMATNANSAGRVTSEGVAGENVNIANGTTYSVLFVGWSANLGTTWSTVLNELQHWGTTGQQGITGTSFFGMSNVGQYSPGAAAPGNTPFATGVIASPNTQLYQLATIPEPGTLALAAIGGASLLLFRRKK